MHIEGDNGPVYVGTYGQKVDSQIGLYPYTLAVSDTNGCSASISGAIQVVASTTSTTTSTTGTTTSTTGTTTSTGGGGNTGTTTSTGGGGNTGTTTSTGSGGNNSGTTTPTDTTPPIITLNGQSSITLSVGDTYTEQGATADDNIDGNLTNNIVVTGSVDTSSPGTYTVTYTVSDASNNTSSIARTITINPDTTAPIALNGQSSITLSVGDTYSEAGATANDNVDGNLTNNIVVTVC